MAEYNIESSTVDKNCGIDCFWTLFAVDVTIIGFPGGIIWSSWPWLQSTVRMGYFVFAVLLLIVAITLFRWNRSLIHNISRIKQISTDISVEASDLQDRHRALSKEYEKVIDRHETLQRQYSIIMLLIDFFTKGELTSLINSPNAKPTDRRRNI